jgi:formate dehydrogenase subunit delta
MMETDKLIKMANQIGDFFEANPDVELAKSEIAGHLQKFWNSVMVNSLVEYVRNDGSALHPKVVQAIKQHLY